MRALNLLESMKLAEKYGVKFVETIHAKTETELLQACHKIGFPVAVKIVSSKIVHKTEKKAVFLSINTQKEALEAFSHLKSLSGFEGAAVQKMVQGIEIIIGGKTDPAFGPTILFGLGGIFVEVFKDYSVRVCPITSRDAKEMIESLKGYPLLLGVRGRKGANLALLKKELLNASKMLLHEPQIKELDLNPLIATPSSVLAVDARVIV